MDKATFINTLKETRAEWDALLTRVGEGRMLEPGAAGKWSVKDVIAHVMWSELEIVPVMGTHVLSGSELWNLPEDERNEIVYQQYRDRPLQDIVTEERRVYDQFLEAAHTLSDEDLNDPHHFRDMPEAWIPWRIFAGCSFQHYRDHMPSILEWLATGKE